MKRKVPVGVVLVVRKASGLALKANSVVDAIPVGVPFHVEIRTVEKQEVQRGIATISQQRPRERRKKLLRTRVVGAHLFYWVC